MSIGPNTPQMKQLCVKTRKLPELLMDQQLAGRDPPWTIWLVEEDLCFRLELRLRCQGYTVVVRPLTT